VEQGLGLNVEISMFLYVYKLKNKFQFEEGGIVIVFFCWILDPAAVEDCTKFPSLITNVLLKLVRDITNGICYQRHEKRLEQQKGYPDVNVCAAEEHLEEKL